ncbi:hypothetical protein [Bosea thiooxidans]
MYADQPFAYPRRLSTGAFLIVLAAVVVGSAAALVALVPIA